MPHPRQRLCLELFKRKLRFQRVVLVQGVRQCGKSFFLRELFAKSDEKIQYLTLDQPSELRFAMDNPETFLKRTQGKETIIIDEAQKVPMLFDTVKFLVDTDPRPGQFVLAGSTEFSVKSSIRESLTGRATTLKMLPLTLGEAHKVDFKKLKLFALDKPKYFCNRSQLMRHLCQGGMPGIFYVNDPTERRELIQDWIQLTTQRDIQQLRGGKKDSQLALDILQQVAVISEPTAAEIAKSLRISGRKINAHVEALKTLFALAELPPSSFGTGKPRLYLCDVSFATYFKASFKRQLETFYLQEILAFQSYFGIEHLDHLSYYRTTKGSIVDFIYRNSKGMYSCIKIHDRESLNQLDIRNLKSLATKIDGATTLIAAAGVGRPYLFEGVNVMPWEGIVTA